MRRGTTFAEITRMLYLAWWQWLALVGSAAIAIVGGKLLGQVAHRALYRLSLLTHTPADDRIVLRLRGPIELLCALLLWEIALDSYPLPDEVVAFGRELGQIGLLVAFAWAGMRVIDTGIETIAVRSKWITGHRVSQSLLPVVRRIAKVIVAVIAIVMILSSLGYAVGALVAGLGVTGIAIALAAQKTLENVFGAFAIGVDHPFREGDFIRLDNGLMGTIETIGLRSTRVRTLDRTLVTVPNGKLADAQIETFNERDRMRFDAKLHLAFGTSSKQIERVLAELRRVLARHPQRGPEEPSVHIIAVQDAWFELEVMAWFRAPSWEVFEGMRDQLLMTCLDVIEACGIQLHNAPAQPPRPLRTRTAGGLS